MFELFLSKTPNKEASPATARQARHTTEKYSLLFSFCARPIFFSSNEKSIFLRCSAFQVFRQVAGLSSIWFRKGKAEFPPKPPFRFSFAQTERERQARAGKNSFPPTPFLFARLLGIRPQNFSADGFWGCANFIGAPPFLTQQLFFKYFFKFFTHCTIHLSLIEERQTDQTKILIFYLQINCMTFFNFNQ